MAFHWEEGIEYARYIDEDRQNIEVMHIVEEPTNAHGREARLHVLPVDEKDDQFKALLEHFTYDEIMEMTYSYNKQAERAFEEQVMSIARKFDMLRMEDFGVTSDQFIGKLIDVLFVEELPEDELKEVVFKAKLQLFELDKVKNSSNRSLKSKLRKAKTLAAVLHTMMEIEEDNLKTT